MRPQIEPDEEYLAFEHMIGLPFSEAVRVGAILYLSGMIGIDSSMKLSPGGITAETRQEMENIKATSKRRVKSALDSLYHSQHHDNMSQYAFWTETCD